MTQVYSENSCGNSDDSDSIGGYILLFFSEFLFWLSLCEKINYVCMCIIWWQFRFIINFANWHFVFEISIG